MEGKGNRPFMVMGSATAVVAALVWTVLVLASLWAQREQLDRTAESLARIDAVANLRKDMAIRKWASVVGGVFIDERRMGSAESLDEQERVHATRNNGEAVKLVSVTPIHLLLAIQEVSNKEYGLRERLTSQQLRNLANAPDDWETRALDALKNGSEMVTEAMPKKGGHGLMRVMIPMRMEKECLECHRDTLVPVGGLRGGAAISVDLNAYRTAQEPTWRTIQYWHSGIWLFGLFTIYAYWFYARRVAGAREAREEERRENAAAFSAMAEGAIITDAQGSILWVNDAFCRIYGYSRDEAIGRNPRILKSGRHDESFYRRFWQELTTTGRWRGELWNRRKDGEVFPEEISVQALRDADGRIVRFVSIFSDITERKRSEAELQRHREHLEDLVRQRTEELTVARDQAESASRAKSIFLANMSHELRTPLNAVIGFSQLMEKDAGLTPVQRRNLEIIGNSGNHLLTLINDVLELSKIESGKTVVSADECDPHALARDVVEMMRVRAEQGGLDIRFASENLPAGILVDTVKLRQVLLNLLSNAVKFTPAGDVVLHAKAVPAGDGRVRLDLAVRDTGIGIAAEDVARIFRPFEQAEYRAHPGGTGLGLTISRQYVEMMGGRLEVDSEPGRGSEFRFSLVVPLGPRNDWEGAAHHVVGISGDAGARRILVVDDQRESRLLLRSLLEPLGFEVHERSGGHEAEAAAAFLGPDLILMDWRLPGVDGLEATRRIRANAALRQPRIVVLTAHVLDDSRARALASGADAFLAKPFREADLLAEVATQLGLELRYEPVAKAAAGAAGCADGWAADAHALAGVEESARDRLRSAALSLDPERIAAALEALAGGNPQLADRLRHAAVEMDYVYLWRVLGLADTEETPAAQGPTHAVHG